MSSSKISHIILTFLVICSSALSLKCYICSSYQDARCADLKVSNDSSGDPLLQECPPQKDKSLCRKTVQTLTDNDKTIVTRNCGWLKFENHQNEDYCMTSNTNFKKEISCQCFGEGCNGGTGLTSSSAIIFLLVFLTIKLSSR